MRAIDIRLATATDYATKPTCLFSWDGGWRLAHDYKYSRLNWPTRGQKNGTAKNKKQPDDLPYAHLSSSFAKIASKRGLRRITDVLLLKCVSSFH
jgi:hypothetical protein